MSTKLDELKAYLNKIYMYSHVNTLMYWDKDTGMPSMGADSRIEAMDFFSTEQFKLETSDELKGILNSLCEPSTYEALDEDWKLIVDRMKEDIDRYSRIPVDFHSEYVRAQAESSIAWAEAKNSDNYDVFKPHLARMIELSKKRMEYMYPEKDAYDAMLDCYEKGMDSETIDRIFSELRDELVPLIKQILAAKQPSDAPFKTNYDINAERRVQDFLLEYIGFDFERGTTGESEHPFTLNFDSMDVRVTNHFRADDAIDPMFSAIHEGGHAIFEQNINPAYKGTVLGSINYMGLHESQSRFYENILGRNRNFWLPIYGQIQELQPELKKISIEKFYREINHVRASYIRTSADEVTYCMHIIIRYELEKAIFRDGVDTDRLPELWNEKMQEYLGIVPSNYAEGILQDMHWGDGSFGYFPSYLLGSIYDGMLLEAVERELGSVDKLLKEGRIKEITKWLNENIHIYGSKRTPAEVIAKICNTPVTSRPLMKYFSDKYKKIYNL